MKFYSRKKKYKYSTGFLFYWNFKAKDGRWRQRQIYWGNRETEHITSRYECIKNIAQLSDGLERRFLIRKIPWLNRGVEDFSDEFFSESIYLRLQELKNQTPELPRQQSYRRPYRPRKKKIEVEKLDLDLPTKGQDVELLNPHTEIIRDLAKIMDAYRERVQKHCVEVIRKANRIIEFGEKLGMLIGMSSFEKHHFKKYGAAFPVGTTLKFCRFALATRRNNPKPVESFNQAAYIFSREPNLKNWLANRGTLNLLVNHSETLEEAIATLKIRPNLVPTIFVAINRSESQFYWELFK